jgi:predicted amidohydrolase
MNSVPLRHVFISTFVLLLPWDPAHAQDAKADKQDKTAADKSDASVRPGGRELRVAAAQIPVSRDIDENVKTISRAIDRASAERADILLTPEGSLSGYTHEFDQSQVDRALDEVVKRSSAAQLALALGTCYTELDDNRCYNQIRFYGKDGAFLGAHTKTLLCGTLTKSSKGEINHFSVRPLRTYQLEGITVGGLICNDLWANPQCTPMPDAHLTQQLSAQGAKIIFHAVNGGRSDNEWSEQVNWPYHEANLRMRAASGAVWIVTADNCEPMTIPCSAPSGVLQPDGKWAAKAPNRGEHLVVHTIQVD